jgi:hypothetical protein
LLKVGLESGPGSAFRPILIERRKATVELLALGGCERKLVVLETVPELGDQREALRGGQTGDFVTGE